MSGRAALSRPLAQKAADNRALASHWILAQETRQTSDTLTERERYREKDRVSVFLRQREKKRESLCVCMSESERERDRERESRPPPDIQGGSCLEVLGTLHSVLSDHTVEY